MRGNFFRRHATGRAAGWLCEKQFSGGPWELRQSDMLLSQLQRQAAFIHRQPSVPCLMLGESDLKDITNESGFEIISYKLHNEINSNNEIVHSYWVVDFKN